MSMKTVDVNFSQVGRRKSYNSMLQHMVLVTDLVAEVGKGNTNLADLLNQFLDEERISAEQLLPIISVLLEQKFEYDYKSQNLLNNVEQFEGLVAELQKWIAIDMVVVYFSSNEGISVINPKNVLQWQEKVQVLNKKELLVAYAKSVHKGPDSSPKLDHTLSQKALEVFFEFLSGKRKPGEVDTKIFQKKNVSQTEHQVPASPQIDKSNKVSVQGDPQAAEKGRPPSSAPAANTSKKVQMTPKYSVQVSNELFHNGNVEAWKNIIGSYHIRYPQLRVLVFYEGEFIQDLNALFKWGKVKHGGVLMFQVSGPQVKGVSRLQKYLFEGASSRYENFLKKDIHRQLDLF